MNEPFMLAARDRRAKVNDRITFAVLLAVVFFLAGMAFQSVLSSVLEPKAAAAVERMGE